MDKIIRAMEENGKLRIFGAFTTDMVNEACGIHHTSPVVSAAFGRLLTANCMMGTMLKGDKETISLQIKGNGPVGLIVTVGRCDGTVRGYVGNSMVDLPLKPSGKLDVSGCIGTGYLTVIRDLGLKEPYIGRVELQTGEIAEDLTYYFAASEQTPSAVALGVLVDRDYSIRASGGYIIQLMPQAREQDIQRLEENISGLSSVTSLIDQGNSIEDILKMALRGFSWKVTDAFTPAYRCNCSHEKMLKAVASIGRHDLEELIEQDHGAELTCHFCNTKYCLDEKDLRGLLEE